MKNPIFDLARCFLFTFFSLAAFLSPRTSSAQQDPRNQWRPLEQTLATEKIKKWIALNGRQSQLKPIKSNSNIKTLNMGTKDGGGGDEAALVFGKFAHNALLELQIILPTTYQELAMQNLNAVLENAKVLLVDEALDVEINDLIQNSTLVNIPELQTILVNRTRWQGILDEKLKNALALHEILSLQKIERTGFYPISMKYWLAASSADVPNKKKDVGNIPNALYSCAISSDNMIGVGSEYLISLSQDGTLVRYSQYSSNPAYHAEVGRTRRKEPAFVTRKGTNFHLQMRLYNVDGEILRPEYMVLDAEKNFLDIFLVDGGSYSIPCSVLNPGMIK